MKFFTRSDPRKDYFYEEFSGKKHVHETTDTYPNRPRTGQSSVATQRPSSSPVWSLRSDQACTRLGHYVATKLSPKLGRYVATKLSPKLGHYVATELSQNVDIIHALSSTL
ncbi:hypothetical protein F2Q69_00054611 [Brassica cretica]|uniref:Uncharacterized protein n=1 Tax=Brassica cretica TaxID=69181 RepID=A0A8S9N2X4_BRACR|nr:hypothetical protein F2Q69_00054611 [Brassica cretica]